MNPDILKGKLKELKGQAKQKWSKLTDDDFELIQGKKEELLGVLQKRYGYSKEEAQKEIEQFEKENIKKAA